MDEANQALDSMIGSQCPSRSWPATMRGY